MPTIKINEKYQISSDAMQWMVQKKKGIDKTTKEVLWENLAYLPSLESAINSLFQYGVRTIDSDIPAEIKTQMETLRQDISRAVHKIDDAEIIR